MLRQTNLSTKKYVTLRVFLGLTDTTKKHHVRCGQPSYPPPDHQHFPRSVQTPGEPFTPGCKGTYAFVFCTRTLSLKRTPQNSSHASQVLVDHFPQGGGSQRGGGILPLGVIWQYLETCLVVLSVCVGWRGCYATGC